MLLGNPRGCTLSLPLHRAGEHTHIQTPESQAGAPGLGETGPGICHTGREDFPGAASRSARVHDSGRHLPSVPSGPTPPLLMQGGPDHRPSACPPPRPAPAAAGLCSPPGAATTQSRKRGSDNGSPSSHSAGGRRPASEVRGPCAP